MIDTPGVLWPKLGNETIALNLAFVGTIKDDILQTLEVGYQLLKVLLKGYSQNLIERYQLEEQELKGIVQNIQLEENEIVIEVMNLIGRKRGAIMVGGQINQERVANILLDDFRRGKLGKITLEKAENKINV